MKFLIQFELKYSSYITAKNYHLNIKCIFLNLMLEKLTISDLY